MGFSSRLCSRISSPSRKTSVRKPSHFGSNSQPSPEGNSSAEAESIGASGGSKGRFILLSCVLHTHPEKLACLHESTASGRYTSADATRHRDRLNASSAA